MHIGTFVPPCSMSVCSHFLLLLQLSSSLKYNTHLHLSCLWMRQSDIPIYFKAKSLLVSVQQQLPIFGNKSSKQYSMNLNNRIGEVLISVNTLINIYPKCNPSTFSIRIFHSFPWHNCLHLTNPANHLGTCTRTKGMFKSFHCIYNTVTMILINANKIELFQLNSWTIL